MVNNLGATTEMELAIVARHAVGFLAGKGFTVERIYAGTFLSSLDMAGISISVLGLNEDRLRWLDAPTTAPAWPNAAKQRPGNPDRQIAVEVSTAVSSGSGAQTEAGRKTRQAIEAACQRVVGRRKRADGDGPRDWRRRPGRQHGACGKGGSGRNGVLSVGRRSRHAQSARPYAPA